MAKQQKAPGRNGFKYQERYGIIVMCRDARAAVSPALTFKPA